METRNYAPFIAIGIILVIILLSQQTDYTKKIFTEKEKSKTTLSNNLGNGVAFSEQTSHGETTTQEETKDNLCNKLSPYISSFNLQNICGSNGGQWICNAEDVGCYNLPTGIIDCDLVLVKTALSQCTANDFCDSKTIYCKY
jgi:hypothetical protein